MAESMELCPDPGMQLQVMNVAWDAVERDGRPIIVAQTGSRAYGTHHERSDYDFKGVYLARLDRVFSMQPPARTADLNEPHDIVLYELAHFCKLAAAANPTVLEILWSDSYWNTPEGVYLRACRGLFLSKRIVKTYGGYAVAQMEKARKGTGGSRGADHHTRDKFKLHTLRLLDAGLYAIQSGEVMVKHPDPDGLRERAHNASLEAMELAVQAGYLRMQKAAAESALLDEPRADLLDSMIFNLRTQSFS